MGVEVGYIILVLNRTRPSRFPSKTYCSLAVILSRIDFVRYFVMLPQLRYPLSHHIVNLCELGALRAAESPLFL